MSVVSHQTVTVCLYLVQSGEPRVAACTKKATWTSSLSLGSRLQLVQI